MTWLVLGALLSSFAVSAAAAAAVRRWGPACGFVDRPGPRKIHARPMPTAGGLAIWLGMVLPLAVGQAFLWLLPLAHHRPPTGVGLAALRLPASIEMHLPGLWEQSGRLWIILAAGTLLLGLGLWDDRRGLDWRFRLTVQTAVAVIMVALGWRFGALADWPWLCNAVSVVWIVWLVNAFNMLDNMDGLSAGVAAIAATLLAVVMLAAGNPLTAQPQLFIGGFLLVLVGALAGFLVHNWAPARLFMGDGGSYLIGFWIALATLTATFAGGRYPAHAAWAPLCVLAVPWYDTVSVLWIRLRAGRSPFVGDRNHFSHRLVALGMTPPQAVLTIYLATATCGLGAFLLHQVDRRGAVVVLAMVACVLALVAVLEIAGRRKLDAPSREPSDEQA